MLARFLQILLIGKQMAVTRPGTVTAYNRCDAGACLVPVVGGGTPHCFRAPWDFTVRVFCYSGPRVRFHSD